MTTRVVTTDRDKAMFIRFIEGFEPPFTATLTKGKHRSVAQNRLQRLWCNEVADQRGDRTAEEVRGETKLRIGVPILRAENETFCESYDRVVKPLPYKHKLECMMEPLDFPVTRLMTSKQKTKYLDQMYRYWTAEGVELTIPDWGQEEFERCHRAA